MEIDRSTFFEGDVPVINLAVDQGHMFKGAICQNLAVGAW